MKIKENKEAYLKSIIDFIINMIISALNILVTTILVSMTIIVVNAIDGPFLSSFSFIKVLGVITMIYLVNNMFVNFGDK